ncbi:MAG: YidC/Oxa1 family membrane protein insertase [Bryobacteraceae bacterium]
MYWSDVIELLRALIFGVAHVCNGSVGVAVILVSFTIRLALLPLTLRLARRAREHQRRLRELQPEVERLRRRFANDPARLLRETHQFYRRRGVKQFDSAVLFGSVAQIPVFTALYSVLRKGLGSGIRFFWIGDTSLPNLLLNVTVAGIAAASVTVGGSADTSTTTRLVMGVLIGGVTVWFLSSTSALFALSTGAGSIVGLLQAWLLRRDSSRRALSAPRSRPAPLE